MADEWTDVALAAKEAKRDCRAHGNWSIAPCPVHGAPAFAVGDRVQWRLKSTGVRRTGLVIRLLHTEVGGWCYYLKPDKARRSGGERPRGQEELTLLRVWK